MLFSLLHSSSTLRSLALLEGATRHPMYTMGNARDRHVDRDISRLRNPHNGVQTHYLLRTHGTITTYCEEIYTDLMALNSLQHDEQIVWPTR